MIRLAKTGYSSYKQGQLWCIEVTPHRITLESECCSLKQPIDIPSLKNSVLPMMFFNSSYVSISSTPLTLQ